ncbi:MAG: hypothetical protein V1907_04270 [Candidatus Kerfeldbacteria bacterium]
MKHIQRKTIAFIVGTTVVIGGCIYAWYSIDVIRLKVLTPVVRPGDTLVIRASGFVASWRFSTCESISIQSMTGDNGNALPVDFYPNSVQMPPDERSTDNIAENQRNYLRNGSGIMRKDVYDHLKSWAGLETYIEDIGGCIGIGKPGPRPDFLKHLTSMTKTWIVLPGTPPGTYSLAVKDPNLLLKTLTFQVSGE